MFHGEMEAALWIEDLIIPDVCVLITSTCVWELNSLMCQGEMEGAL